MVTPSSAFVVPEWLTTTQVVLWSLQVVPLQYQSASQPHRLLTLVLCQALVKHRARLCSTPLYTVPSPGQVQGKAMPSPGQAQGKAMPSPGQAQGKAMPSPGQAQGKAMPSPGQAQGKAPPKYSPLLWGWEVLWYLTRALHGTTQGLCATTQGLTRALHGTTQGLCGTTQGLTRALHGTTQALYGTTQGLCGTT